MKPKHLILFTVLLCMGLFIEGLKKMAGMDQTPKSVITQEPEERPFQVSTQQMSEDAESQSARGRMNHGGFKLATVQKAEILPGADVLAAATAAADDKLAKAAADQAKKKKKKKKKDPNGRGHGSKNSEELLANKQKSEKNKTKDRKKVDPLPAPVAATPAPVTPDVADQDPIKKVMGYQEWAKLILGRPQPENVTKLVQAYKTRRVTNEVFYNLLSAMMNESNPEQHKLAVSAANEVPSAQGYIFLYAVLKSEKQESEVSEQAARALQTYTRLNQIGYLRNVFTGSINDTAFVTYSLEILDRSTQTYLEQRTVSSDPTQSTQQTDMSSNAPPTQPENQTQSMTLLRRAYLPYLPILEKLIQTQANQQSIVELAQRSLNRIKNIQVVQQESKG